MLVYSLDNNLIFEPFDLSEDKTPKIIRNTLKSKDYGLAFIMTLKLNESKFTREVYETIFSLFVRRSIPCLSILCCVFHRQSNKLLVSHRVLSKRRWAQVRGFFKDLSAEPPRPSVGYLLSLGIVAQKQTVGSILSLENGDEELFDEEKEMDFC